jgi:hypothetical protein
MIVTMKNIIRQKIIDSIATPVFSFTRRDARLPMIPGKTVAVIGMRRTGKSTFLWQTLFDRLANGVQRESLLYFSFEDERLAEMKAADLHILLEEYYQLYPSLRDKSKVSFFLDEIQGVRGWEAFARRIMDTEKIDLFISGSSAKLLSREVATSMRGRAMTTLIYPFSFREYLRHLGRDPVKDAAHLTKAMRSGIEKDLRDFLSFGGFPESMGAAAKDREDLLRGYIDTTLLRDVIERYEVSHPVALRWLVRHLLANAAGSFSISKFYTDLRSQGIPVAKDTLHSYLAYLEDSFLVRILPIATGSERVRMVNPRKIYPIDAGLIPLFEMTGRSNLGHALETCIMLELERRGADLTYIRTSSGSEVDFLARYADGRRELVQVCADMDGSDVRDREVRGLIDGLAEHKGATAHLIVLNPRMPKDLPTKIRWHAASDWLLSLPH